MNLPTRILTALVIGGTAFVLNTYCIDRKIESSPQKDLDKLKIIAPSLALASIYFLRQGGGPLAGGLGIGACMKTVGFGGILYSSLALITNSLIPSENGEMNITNSAFKILNALTAIAIGVYAGSASATAH